MSVLYAVKDQFHKIYDWTSAWGCWCCGSYCHHPGLLFIDRHIFFLFLLEAAWRQASVYPNNNFLLLLWPDSFWCYLAGYQNWLGTPNYQSGKPWKYRGKYFAPIISVVIFVMYSLNQIQWFFIRTKNNELLMVCQVIFCIQSVN